MLVFGDCIELAAPFICIDALEGKLSSRTGVERTAHADLVSAFVFASELVQGILDAEFSTAAEDFDSPARQSATRLMMAMAGCVQWSWQGRRGANPFDEIQSAIAELRDLQLPPLVPCKRAEGYAFYALYPESYLQAAAGLATSERWRVIGIRSIGTGLAALVSVGLGAGLPILVRPVGENSQRRLALSPSIAKAMLEDTVERFAIVDEGPGLSGGSFGCVADYLEQHGIARDRIGFFPSHSGDLGCLASEAHRQRWRTANRYHIGFDQLARPTDGATLCALICDPIGAAQKPLVDVSAGGWRAHRFTDPEAWPAVNMTQERRKYLLYSEDGPYLIKFAGLGHYGTAKRARAELLSQAGFTPQLKGWSHGFLVEHWMADACMPDIRAQRATFLARLADYLAFRARHFPAPPRSGATLQALGAMLSKTAAYLLGSEQAALCREWAESATRLEAEVRRVATDNRLQCWEWLQLADGTILKTDALDHCESHDLIGCQDIAWDIAGAAAEFQLSHEEVSTLSARIRNGCGYQPSDDLVRFLLPCYLAFQCDYYVLAGRAASARPDEVARLHRQLALYKDALWSWIDDSGCSELKGCDARTTPHRRCRGYPPADRLIARCRR